ncbi:hypothetical protein EVB67_021 [Rhizobium phage RHph_TM3_3_14B]|nr:hypothetical protein EVB67_021 [Rhizobium phage RHph_TM3_3_14B]
MIDHTSEDHCSRWGGIPQDRLTDFNRRAIGLLCRGFGLGPWNIPVNWDRVKWGSECHTEFVTSGHGLATWDFNRLTRLVIGAHDECIRVEISPRAFRYLSIEMWPRQGREGCMSVRHPTIEEAIASYRMAA